MNRVIRWARNPYLGEGIEDWKEIRTKVNKGDFLPTIFLVTLSNHPDHVLEIIPSFMLRQKWNRKTCPKIVGIAKGITKTGELIVATEDGEQSVSSGEVSVRGIYGYV